MKNHEGAKDTKKKLSYFVSLVLSWFKKNLCHL